MYMHRRQAGRGGESGGQEDVAAKLGQRPAVYYRSQLVAGTNYFVFLWHGRDSRCTMSVIRRQGLKRRLMS